jgi:Tfp pilus assembly protein PilN
MAIHLNLYHEVLKNKALKRRDPLKISIYALAAIAACCAGWYTFQLVTMHGINDAYLTRKAEWDKAEPAAKQAKKKEDELTMRAGMSVQIVKRMEERFYWAPLLAQLTQVVPREVQITRLSGEVIGEHIRHCSMTIDGISAGADPRRVAEALRTAVAERLSPQYTAVTSTFKTLDDGAETVMLDGRQVGTAVFAINVQLTYGDDKPTTPQRRRR